MGWFGYGALDGDDGLDLRSQLFDLVGIEFNEKDEINQTNQEIKDILETNQKKIYDWLRDYDWNSRFNPGFIQEIYIQATAQIFVDYGVEISDRGKKGFIDFIKNDQWSKKNEKRKEAMKKLLLKIKKG